MNPATRNQAADLLRYRAANYRLFIPGWPALADSLEREAVAMLAAPKDPPPLPRKAPK